MDCLVLAKVREGIPHEDSATRQALANFEEYISTIDAFGQLAASPSYEKFTSGPLRKWRSTNFRRIVYATLSTTKRKIPYVVVIAADSHQVYTEKLNRNAFHRYSLDSLRTESEVLGFVAMLDAKSTVEAVIPAGYIGLTQPLAVLEITDDEPVLEESAGYVEKVLSLFASGKTVSLESAREVVGPVLETVTNRKSGVVDVLGTKVRVSWSGESVYVTLDEEFEPAVRRRMPLQPVGHLPEYLLECEAASAAQVDPFMVWDEAQRRLLVDLSSAPHSLPAFIDGPGGSGKTAILMWLVRGVIQHRDWYVPGTRVRLVTASLTLAEKIEQGLRNHLRLVDGYSQRESNDLAADVCRTVDSYLLEFIPESNRVVFAPSKKVDWRSFHRWYSSLHVPGPLTPHEAWCAIRILIRGDTIGREDPRFEVSAEVFNAYLEEWFGRLNDRRRQGLTIEQFHSSLDVHRRYMSWKSTGELWDDADLVKAAHDSLAGTTTLPPSADMLVVDEAQDLTPDTLRLMVRTCGAARQRIDVLAAEGKPVRIPLIFAADDLQTINPSGFDWGGFRAVFHEETTEILNSPHGISVEPVGLDVNFRMREAVHGVAHSIRRWMRPTTPVSPPESRRTGGYSGPCRSQNQADVTELLAQVERIIIPGELDSYSEDSPLRKFLAEHNVDVENGVTPVGATKGDEFSTVALVGFAERVRNTSGTQEEKFAKQVTYVAASRARDAAVWVEISGEDLEWFWKSDDHRSPSRVLPQVHNFSLDRLDPFKVSSEQRIVRELQRVRHIIGEVGDTDDNRRTRIANAASSLAVAGAEEYADAALKISRYFAGERKPFSFGVLPAEVDEAFIDLAIGDAAWRVFDGPHSSGVPLDVLGGWAVSALERRSPDDLLLACRSLDDAGLTRSTDLDERLARGLKEAGGFLAGVLEAAVVSGNTQIIDVITPTELTVLDVLGDGMMLNERFAIFQDWARGNLAAALRGCARFDAAGNTEVAVPLNRRIVAVEAGVPWIARSRVREAEVTTRMTDEQILGALDAACLQLCGLDDVKRRISVDLAEGTGRYTDAQLLRYMLVTAREGADSLEKITKEKHDVV